MRIKSIVFIKCKKKAFQKCFNKSDQQIKWQMKFSLEKYKVVHIGKVILGTSNSIKQFYKTPPQHMMLKRKQNKTKTK